MSTGMPRLTFVLGVTLAALTFQTGSGAMTKYVLDPIRSTGDEIGLIFVPGAFMKEEQYIKTARAIQKATELRVWVALTGDYTHDLTSPDEVSDAVEDAISKFERNGMTSGVYIGVAHGFGGNHLQVYAPDSDLDALVLMGSTLARDTELRDFPIPVLTLAGELDGLTRMTRVAEEYEKLKDDVLSFFRGIYRTPVIFIEGTNHAQFASGDMQPQIKAADLLSNVTEEQAHSMIGKHINDFLTVHFSTEDSHVDVDLDFDHANDSVALTLSTKNIQVEAALDQLVEAFLKSSKKFQPFLDIRDLDTDGEESMWTVLAQELFAGEYGDRVAVSNEITANPWFFTRQPTMTPIGDDVVVHTVALVHTEAPSDIVKIEGVMESPLEIAMKLVSKDAIWKMLKSQNDTSLRSEPNTCQKLNRAALFLALAVSSDASRERYLAQGRQIIFEEDTMRRLNFLWAPTPLSMWEDAAGLHLSAIAMAGSEQHSCKVMSPYRAMEWVNVDSLRAYPVQG